MGLYAEGPSGPSTSAAAPKHQTASKKPKATGNRAKQTSKVSTKRAQALHPYSSPQLINQPLVGTSASRNGPKAEQLLLYKLLQHQKQAWGIQPQGATCQCSCHKRLRPEEQLVEETNGLQVFLVEGPTAEQEKNQK